VRLLYSVVLISVEAPENPRKEMLSGKSCSWEKSRVKAHPDGYHFKKVLLKTIFKLKINLLRNSLNFVSIQQNFLHASPISRDYSFKTSCHGEVKRLCYDTRKAMNYQRIIIYCTFYTSDNFEGQAFGSVNHVQYWPRKS
jgi:hypothetical protein